MITLLAARIILSSLFLAASLGKIFSLSTFADEILDYHLLTKRQAQVIAYTLPFTELVLSVFVLLGIALVLTSILIISLLFIFVIAIIINLKQGRHFSCHCFGGSGGMIGPAMLLRNLLLITLTLWIFRHASEIFDIKSLIISWRIDVQKLANIDVLVSCIGVVILSLIILFLLSELDTLFVNMRDFNKKISGPVDTQ